MAYWDGGSGTRGGGRVPPSSDVRQIPSPSEQMTPDTEENVIDEAEDVIRNFIFESYQHQLVEEADTLDSTTPDVPELCAFTSDLMSRASQVGRQLARIGDDKNREYADEFKDMINQLNMTEDTPYEVFAGIAKKLFADEINWGRVAALMCLAYRITMTVVKEKAKNFAQFMKVIVSHVVRFIKEKIAWWIARQGGWISVRKQLTRPCIFPKISFTLRINSLDLHEHSISPFPRITLKKLLTRPYIFPKISFTLQINSLDLQEHSISPFLRNSLDLHEHFISLFPGTSREELYTRPNRERKMSWIPINSLDLHEHSISPFPRISRKKILRRPSNSLDLHPSSPCPSIPLNRQWHGNSLDLHSSSPFPRIPLIRQWHGVPSIPPWHGGSIHQRILMEREVSRMKSILDKEISSMRSTLKKETSSMRSVINKFSWMKSVVGKDFIAMTAVMDKELIAMTAVMEKKISGMKADMEKKFSGMKTDMENDFSKVRADMENDFSKVRADMENDFSKVRADMEKEISRIRSVMEREISRMKSIRAIGHHKRQLNPKEDYKWMKISNRAIGHQKRKIRRAVKHHERNLRLIENAKRSDDDAKGREMFVEKQDIHKNSNGSGHGTKTLKSAFRLAPFFLPCAGGTDHGSGQLEHQDHSEIYQSTLDTVSNCPSPREYIQKSIEKCADVCGSNMQNENCAYHCMRDSSKTKLVEFCAKPEILFDYCPEYDPVDQTIQKDTATLCNSKLSRNYYNSSDIYFCDSDSCLQLHESSVRPGATTLTTLTTGTPEMNGGDTQQVPPLLVWILVSVVMVIFLAIVLISMRKYFKARSQNREDMRWTIPML